MGIYFLQLSQLFLMSLMLESRRAGKENNRSQKLEIEERVEQEEGKE